MEPTYCAQLSIPLTQNPFLDDQVQQPRLPTLPN